MRDFVHVKDVALANLAALETLVSPAPGVPSGHRAYNVASGEPHTVLDLASALARERGGPEPVVVGGGRPGDVRLPRHHSGDSRVRRRRRPRGLWPREPDLHDPDQWRRGLDHPGRRVVGSLTGELTVDERECGQRLSGCELHGLPQGRPVMRRLLTSLLAAILATSPATAWAFWGAGSATGGYGAAAVSSVNQGATPTASAVAQAVTVSWAASMLSNGQAVTGHQVKRYDANTMAPQTILASCDGAVAGRPAWRPTCLQDPGSTRSHRPSQPTGSHPSSPSKAVGAGLDQ